MTTVTLVQTVATASAGGSQIGVGLSSASVELQLGVRGADGRDGEAPPWGDIIGNLDDQVDLKTRLDSKINQGDTLDGGNF